jgi:hypothetical protein
MAMSQQRARDADRTFGQLFVGYRGKERFRFGAHWSYQERQSVSSSSAPDLELDIYSAYAIYDIAPKKWSVFVRWDRYDDPCGTDCTAIDYLPIDGNEPFDLLIAGVEWYLHPSVRFSPNIEYVMYDDAPAPLVQPQDDELARLTFFWTF